MSAVGSVLFDVACRSVEAAGVRNHMAVVLVAPVLAKLAGETTSSGTAGWVPERKFLFLVTLRLKRQLMSHNDTYRRILNRAVDRLFVSFTDIISMRAFRQQ
jgi:hypothetical protein